MDTLEVGFREKPEHHLIVEVSPVETCGGVFRVEGALVVIFLSGKSKASARFCSWHLMTSESSIWVCLKLGLRNPQTGGAPLVFYNQPKKGLPQRKERPFGLFLFGMNRAEVEVGDFPELDPFASDEEF